MLSKNQSMSTHASEWKSSRKMDGHFEFFPPSSLSKVIVLDQGFSKSFVFKENESIYTINQLNLIFYVAFNHALHI